MPGMGRFAAEDGMIYFKSYNCSTYNLSVYCRSNPLAYIDNDGKDVYYFYDSEAFIGDKGEKESVSKEQFRKEDVNELNSKNVGMVVLLGCNTARTDVNDNMVTRLIDDERALGIEYIIASDGSVQHIDRYEEVGHIFKKQILYHSLKSVESSYYHKNRKNDGFKLYYYDENNILQYERLGKEFDSIIELLKAGEGCVE